MVASPTPHSHEYLFSTCYKKLEESQNSHSFEHPLENVNLLVHCLHVHDVSQNKFCTLLNSGWLSTTSRYRIWSRGVPEIFSEILLT